ncbi:MAG: hypothetical protein HY958_02995 [Bacteroidia bacterium]|nr:hypothetical protein [Bacteroidia bacterium]
MKIEFYAFIFFLAWFTVFTDGIPFQVSDILLKQDHTGVQQNSAYKDENYKFTLTYPSGYVLKKASEKSILIRWNKDLESVTRISVAIHNFETYGSTGKLYNFSEFVRKHAKNLYEQNNYSGVVDSIMVKDYLNNNSLSGKEVYVRIVNKARNNSGKEEQTIKGPVYIFDITAKVGIPGIAIAIYQLTDDSKTAKVMRSIVDDLKFEN